MELKRKNNSEKYLRVAVVTASKVAVVRRDDRVLGALLDVVTLPLSNARTYNKRILKNAKQLALIRQTTSSKALQKNKKQKQQQ